MIIAGAFARVKIEGGKRGGRVAVNRDLHARICTAASCAVLGHHLIFAGNVSLM